MLLFVSLFTKVCDVIEVRASVLGCCGALWGALCGSGTEGMCTPGGFHHCLSR